MNVLQRAAAIRTELLTASKKPPRTNVIVENIPHEIRQLDRWLLWEWARVNDKWTKRPLCASGGAGSSTDAKTWSSFEVAINAYRRDMTVAGVGIAIADPYVGIDLDKCIDPEWNEADEIVPTVTSRLDSYTEISPSGTGGKILVRATKPRGRCQSADSAKYDVECYDGGRFFTITGDTWPGTPAQINDRSEEVSWFCSTYLETEKPQQPRSKPQETFETCYTSTLDNLLRAREAVQNIPPSFADTYADWIKVGMACKTASEALCDDWIAWSSKSSKFDGEDACRQKWAKLSSDSTLNIGTLVHYGKQSGWVPSWSGASRSNSQSTSNQDVYSWDKTTATDSKPKQTPPMPESVVTSAVELTRRYIEKLRTGKIQQLVRFGDALNGIEIGPGLITPLGAPPGFGKTALAMQLVFEGLQYDHDLKAVIANAETTFEGLLRRELARRSRIKSDAIRFGKLSAEELQEIEQILNDLSPLLERISVVEECSLASLKALIDQPPGLLIVDYLQKFSPPGSDARTGVGQVMGTLRTLAKADWAVVALSATARQPNGRHEAKELTMSSYRDSGEIEFNADSCYLLLDHGPIDEHCSYIRQAELKHVKNRHGAKVDKPLRFHMPRMSFEAFEPAPARHTEFDEYEQDLPENPFSRGGGF